MWFSKVPGYLFDKQRTPYLTEAKDLNIGAVPIRTSCLWCFCR